LPGETGHLQKKAGKKVRMEREKMIEKLKNIKDPIERDRTIWALSGYENDVIGKTPLSAEPFKTLQSGPPEHTQNLPEVPPGVRHLFSYLVPGLILLFGLINILQALMHILPSGNVQEAIPQLIMGGIFVLFGISGIIKARKQVTKAEGHS